MRIQIVPRALDVEEMPDGSRIVRAIDASQVEVALGPIPADKWDAFVEFLVDPEAAKAKQRAASSIHIPGAGPAT